jgi:hypothetical protein
LKFFYNLKVKFLLNKYFIIFFWIRNFCNGSAISIFQNFRYLHFNSTSGIY